MQFKANDGSTHPSQKQAFDAGQKPPAAAPADAQPKSITDDPQAMQLVDQLQQMGYTAEDVEKAMGGADADQGAMAPPAAPPSIPGL